MPRISTTSAITLTSSTSGDVMTMGANAGFTDSSITCVSPYGPFFSR
jgi:hypothetical protein